MPFSQRKGGQEPKAELPFSTDFWIFDACGSKGYRPGFNMDLFHIFNIGVVFGMDLLQETYS